jgi:serine/threonine-protein kinase
MPCSRCGNPFDVQRFCPVCGAEQEADDKERPTDPLVGAIVADRYEILERLNVGGMGAVYRGVQRPLGRAVAVKFIHPHLLTTAGVAERFLNEAQAASRLNHPNVVSIFDFGHTVRGERDQLYLVMELLSGRDLMSEMQRGVPLGLQRLSNIFQQVLAALGEAHHHGITHRDVKPDNVILERTRSGGDHVKVIDFGIAKLSGGGGRALTQAGHVVGTPQYLAPEQLRGAVAGPAADLYAVGVMLFQALTGQFPFEGTPAQILTQQTKTRLPDPRLIAPTRKVPARLAEVCMRTLDPDPAARFPDAESLAEAIQRAAIQRSWSRVDASLFPARRSATPVPPSAPAAEIARAITPARGPTLLGRSAELAWVRAIVAEGKGRPVVVWGRTGIGRTRLLREVAENARRDGALVELVSAPVPPRDEVGFGGLRSIIARLVGTKPDDPLLREAGDGDPEARAGMRTVFGDPTAVTDVPPQSQRAAASAALRWAARRAVRRAAGRRVVLCLDDADVFDGATLGAVRDVLQSAPVEGVTLVATCRAAPEPKSWGAAHERQLTGLSRRDAETITGDPQATAALPEGDDIEPLWAEQLTRILQHGGEPPRTAKLAELIDWRVRALSPPELRVLQAVAVTGGGRPEALGSILSRPEDLEDAFQPLIESGFLELLDDRAVPTHAVFGHVALEMAPLGAVTELHARTAEELAARGDLIELRAYHALRGAPDFSAFLLVEATARLRHMRGDIQGTITALRDAVTAARVQMLRGADEAESAFLLFGHKLGAALVDAGRLEEAKALLDEAVEIADTEKTRALLLEQLYRIAMLGGDAEEAERCRRASIAIAEAAGDRLLVERMRALPSTPGVRASRESAATRRREGEAATVRDTRRGTG